MKNVIYVTLCVLVTACVTIASVTPQTVQIDDNVFETRNTVGITGNRPSIADLANTMLLSAASKSIELRCEYFVATENSSQSFRTPQGEVSEGLSRLSNGQVVYKTALGQIYTVKRPDPMANVFVCFSEKPNALLPGLVFNAKYVKQSLAK